MKLYRVQGGRADLRRPMEAEGTEGRMMGMDRIGEDYGDAQTNTL